MVDLKELSEVLFRGDVSRVKEITLRALQEKKDPKEILEQGLIKGMEIVGIKFKNNEIFLPEVLLASQAMNRGLELLQPRLTKSGVKAVGKVVIGTAKGDLHDIGKNLVAMMLRGGGFEVIDLGIDVSPEKFLKATQEHLPDIVGISALLTTTMIGMMDVITILKKAGLRNKIKVMVGGAPVTQEFADEIGAEGYAPDAASAVDKAKELLKILRR
ncbi:MAG TPA: cobalamin-binding protein [Candidatus Atribacteria bacterium]|jgi:5-methyltetrahydrofolate--homocysteine methyltransferase|nr:MAG: Methyltransferase cognate corrinoid protein [Atribacteria bacterium 34_128]HAJ33076.1 cobalamin-binding protein [Candidatus Atribacteria bacterium]